MSKSDTQYKKSLKLAVKRGLDITLLTVVIDELLEKGVVDSKFNIFMALEK